MKYFFSGNMLGFLLLYFFYHTFYVLFPAFFCGILYCLWKRKELMEQRKRLLEWQFKDWIMAAAANLQAGYSIENAFLKGGGEMKLLYDENSMIQKEISEMERQLSNNITLEYILSDLGNRSGSEDIQNFADVFIAGKRSGGNLKEMIEACCEIIVMKVAVEKEIQTIIHGRKTEQKLMSIIPFGIVIYISISSPGYFSSLYKNPLGICIMTGCLCLYIFSVALSVRIMRIEV